MKIRFFTLFCFLIVSTCSFSQLRVTCSQDTLLYTREKATADDTIILDPFFTQRVYQYFEAPQSVTVSGVRFYAYNAFDTGATSISVTVELRSATNDSLPASGLLASANVTLTHPDSLDGPISDYAHVVTWNPVTVTEDYVVVIKNNSPTQPLAVFRNSQGDGDDEYFNGAYQITGWVRSNFFQVNGVPFNSDFYIQPIVDYSINAGFTNDPECLFDELGEVVTFENTGAPLVDSKMYNRFAFYNLTNHQEWTFGDGTGPMNTINPAHGYPSNGPYSVTMKLTMLSWSNNICTSTITQQVKKRPNQDFTYTTNNLSVAFSNNTSGLFSDVSYTFGDGNYSNSENPLHKFSKPGTYWVCQTMLTSCGYVTHCENVAVATNTALNCGKDSVRFTAARGTDTRTVSFKSSNPGKLIGFGQIFEAPQPLIVHGFSFYATHDGLFRDNYLVTCKIYDKTDEGFPDTISLATATVRINRVDVDTFYNDSVKYTAIFDRPVNITEDYILTVEYDSNNLVKLGSNDYTANDGLSNFRAVAKKDDTTWVSSASSAQFNVNGVAFNADFHFEPLVEYNFDANFKKDPFQQCAGAAPVELTNTSSPIASSPVYNTLAYSGSSSQAYAWDFDDGTPVVNTFNPIHTFVGAGPFDVSLEILIEGWTNTCTSTQSKTINSRPIGGFTFVKDLSTVVFTDTSINAADTNGHWWSFSDNSYSSLKNPTHYFLDTGAFEVCQYVSNECGSDTTCVTIQISVLGVDEPGIEDLLVYPNPATDHLLIKGQLSGKGYMLMYDLTGRPVFQTHLPENTFSQTIDVSRFARGTYLLKFETSQGYAHRKIVLK